MCVILLDVFDNYEYVYWDIVQKVSYLPVFDLFDLNW